MTITTEILYKCLQEFFQKNEKKSDSKRVRYKEFSQNKSNDKRIKLVELFPQYLANGKLILKNIDMYRLVLFFKNADFYVRLKGINFENCVFQDCDFSYLWLDPTDFENASFLGACCFVGTYISATKQQDQERKVRENSWLLKIHEEYPEDYYQYDMHVRSDNADLPFYRFNYAFSEDVKSRYLGWKLHLSVHPTDLAKTFDLVAPIISRYGYSFKMINSKIAFSEGSRYKGAQFTIYLEENNQLLASVEKTQKMIGEITGVLSNHHVRVGEIPDSDAPTIFKYFSLRNDRFDFGDLFIDSVLSREKGVPGYLLTRFTGSNYNSLGRDNPFVALISAPNKNEFDLTKHFAEFKPRDRREASIAYIASFCAWLNKYTHVFDLDPQETIAVKKQCLSKTAKIGSHVFKSEQNATEEFSEAVKLVLCFLMWVSQNKRIGNHFFPLSILYPYNNAFSAALISMEEKINTVEKGKDNNSGVDVTFSEFFQQNLYEKLNTVQEEGEGSKKPQELKLNEKDRMGNYSAQSPHHERPTPPPSPKP